MSPEQWAGGASAASSSVDMWAFGCLLGLMLCGATPYVVQHCQTEPPQSHHHRRAKRSSSTLRLGPAARAHDGSSSSWCGQWSWFGFCCSEYARSLMLGA
jgi:serine/threonine protein kinase